MKVGILTFHFAHNCGACLQAFALKKYFSKIGQDVSILNYIPPKMRNAYPKKLKVKFALYDFKHPTRLGKKIKQLLDFKYGRKEWNRQYHKFELFIRDYLLDNNNAEFSANDVEQIDIDLFVAGSDQIWNKQLTVGYDDIYLLNFKTKARKAFYAVSCGSNYLKEEDLKHFENVFSNENKYISVREPAFASFLSTHFSRPIPSVVDPCFLLSAEDYKSVFLLERTKKPMKSKYLFAYFISERNKRIREMVYVVANALGLEIVEFHYRKGRDLNKKYQTSDMGPKEFLEFIYHSDFVITNSFHGTVFSLIFKKQFYSVYDEDARKDNLLEKMGLSDRHIRDFKDMDLNQIIDYSNIDLDNYSFQSKAFIGDMIKGCEKND